MDAPIRHWQVEGRSRRIDCYRWSEPDPSRADVLVVHGLGDHGRALPYRLLSEALAGRGYGVVTYDHEGHGDVPARRRGVTRWPRLRDDFCSVALQLRGERPPFALGLSMGGALVLDAVAERRLGFAGVAALAAPLGPLSAPLAVVLAARLLGRLLPSLRLPTGLDPQWISSDGELLSAYTADPGFFSRVGAGLGSDLLAVAERIHAGAGRLGDHVLLMHGTADRIAVPDERLRRAPGPKRCAVYLYPEARHNLLIERCRRTVHADLCAWLDGVCAAHRAGAAAGPAPMREGP